MRLVEVPFEISYVTRADRAGDRRHTAAAEAGKDLEEAQQYRDSLASWEKEQETCCN